MNNNNINSHTYNNNKKKIIIIENSITARQVQRKTLKNKMKSWMLENPRRETFLPQNEVRKAKKITKQ